MSIFEKAYAKINLCLDVTERLPDGYHGVRGIMQSIDFCDELEIIPDSEHDKKGWRVECNFRYIPSGETNLAARAAMLFHSTTGYGPQGGLIKIKKRIPVCGGFGGGSSDAAAVLRALNAEYKAGLTKTELEELGLRLGADVPFCIGGGTRLAEGKGEILTPLPFFYCHIVVCRPDFSCSTPELFSAIDKLRMRIRPDVQGMIRAVTDGDIAGVARRLFNVFEEVLPKKQAETVWEMKDLLIDSGAIGAVMTGSGSGIFGIYPSRDGAEEGCRRLKAEGVECYIAQTTNTINI
jgi:4-diphosphocytidyl-2-C-methyl-D-erythritol kinase